MVEFDSAMRYLSDLEGGYSNRPNDRGGPTKYGISLRFYNANVDPDGTIETIKGLTRDEAVSIYREHFWYPSNVEVLDSQDLVNRVFSLAVHAGIKPAVRVLQQAVNYSGYLLAVDGMIGPMTANAANSIDPKQLLPDLRHETWEFYRRLIDRNRAQLGENMLGWRRRALL